MNRSIIIIGYSGHGFVACSILQNCGYTIVGYCDKEEKKFNPFSLVYYGSENEARGLQQLQQKDFFISIGDNNIREKIFLSLTQKKLYPVNAIHTSSIIDATVSLAKSGIMIAAGVIINPLAKIGVGAICNTGCIIEHECIIEDFAHIAPGAVLCGNVQVGKNSFIGAGSVIREGIKVGSNTIVGAGSVVVKDIPDNVKVAGNPLRNL